MMSGECFVHLLFDRGVLGIVREVFPLPLVLRMIVQFFRPVLVDDISIAFGTNSAVPAGLFTETAALRSHITSAANNAVDACGTCMTDLPTKIPILGLERVGDLPPFTQVNGGCLNR